MGRGPEPEKGLKFLGGGAGPNKKHKEHNGGEKISTALKWLGVCPGWCIGAETSYKGKSQKPQIPDKKSGEYLGKNKEKVEAQSA